MNLFPNPTSNKIQLSGFVEEQKQVQLDVLNIVGQLLYSEKIDLKYGKFEHEINTSSFESGAYFIRLSDNESQVSKLFLKIETNYFKIGILSDCFCKNHVFLSINH